MAGASVNCSMRRKPQMGAWRCALVLACWLCAAFGWLAFAGGAFAAVGHGFAWTADEAPVGTPLSRPGAVAVDGASGQVFVGDPGSGYVDVFDGSGGFLTRFGDAMLGVAGVAVDEASGDVYVADAFAEGVDVYGPDGEGGYVLLGIWWGASLSGREFGRVAGIAVDNSPGPSSGDVYVLEAISAHGGPPAIDLFKPNEADPGQEGQFLKRLSGGPLEAPNAIAVSRSSGRVLIADSVKGAILTYSAEGAYEGKLTGKGSPYGSFKGKDEELGNVAGVALEDASGDVYVAEAQRHAVSEYSPSGDWKGWITSTPAGDLGEPRGVALDPSGDVFLADAGRGTLDRFGEGVTVPGVETGKVAKSGLTRTSATFAGTVDGAGKAAKYRFQYGATEALGAETASQSSGTAQQAVSATAEGLQAGHVYFYRLLAENEDGTSYGLIRSLETLPAVAALETGPGSELQPDAAGLSGSLKRGGLTTHYYFQYGTSSSYGSQSPEPPAQVPPAQEEKEEKQPRSLQAALTGLSANTLYHYRLVAENSFGTTYGQDRIFTTSGPPQIAVQPVSAIGQTAATLHATIGTGQSATTYRFEYGESTSYGSEAPPGGEAIGSGPPKAVAAALANLKVGTTYHYRVIAENQAGQTTGEDQTFQTVPSAPVDSTWTSNITGTSAVLHTLINPLGNDTHLYFQYGTEPCRANPEACASIPSPPGTDLGEASQDVAGETALAGLQPDTLYHFRVIATNSLGRKEGAERPFTTPSASPSPAVALPDGRAWEMVSPPDKHGAPLERLPPEGGRILASENGDALTFVANGALGEGVEGNRSPEMQQILATREPTGWSSRDIATPNTKAKGILPGSAPEYQYFSPDLSVALVEPAGAGAEPPLVEGMTQNTIYLRDDETGSYLPVVSEADTAPGTGFAGRIEFVSATPDLSEVVLTSGVPLTGAGSAGGLYEWSGGRLQFVSVLPGGKPAATPELGYFGSVFPHAISSDGSRIIWTNKEENSGRGRLYLRDTAHGQTVRLDAAQGAGEPGEASAQFQGASSDGSRVFFTDRQRLTADATTEVGQAQTSGQPDLYQCPITENAGQLPGRPTE